MAVFGLKKSTKRSRVQRIKPDSIEFKAKAPKRIQFYRRKLIEALLSEPSENVSIAFEIGHIGTLYHLSPQQARKRKYFNLLAEELKKNPAYLNETISILKRMKVPDSAIQELEKRLKKIGF